MAWQKAKQDLSSIRDIRRVGSFTSFCRKCTCHHPLDSEVSGMLKGCICNPARRRGPCGLYVPINNLEFLEYVSIMKEDEADEKN